MKKIINPWAGEPTYHCYGCDPNSESGKTNFQPFDLRMGSILSAIGIRVLSFRVGVTPCTEVFRLRWLTK